MDATVAAMLSEVRLDLEFAVRFVGAVPHETRGVHMELTEGIDYTRTGWREGEEATLENRPGVMRLETGLHEGPYDAWHAHVQAVGALRSEIVNAYEALLTDEQKAERSKRAEAAMMAEAAKFYGSQPKGSNRSYWD
jgi:hypothetical protein